MTNRIYWVWAISNAAAFAGGPENGMYESARPTAMRGRSPAEAVEAFSQDYDIGPTESPTTIAVLDPHTLERWTFNVAKTLTVTPAEVPS